MQATEIVREDIWKRLVELSRREHMEIANESRDWNVRPQDIQHQIEFLRETHHRGQREGRLAADGDTLSVGDVSKMIGCTAKEIGDLESLDLIFPRRTHGGQRRFSVEEISLVRERVAALRSGAFGVPNRRRAAVGGSDATRFDQREVRNLTVGVVAHLYREACERFPNRDRSVVEYIREHMEWLSEDEIITAIRLARKHDETFPLYRRGRIPQGPKKQGVLQA
jgi:DNA-binding transcriptional MerR regulator